MSDIHLYWFWSTNPQKVRFALEEMKLPYTLHKINLGTKENQSPEYLSINPKGQVPALSIDGQVITESNAILLSLATRFGLLWPSGPQEQSKAMELLFFESGTFSSLAGTHYYNLVVRPLLGVQPNRKAIEKAKKRLIPILNRFEEHFSSNDYLLSSFSIVDCSYAVWLPHISLENHPNVRAWRDRLMSKEGWKKSGLRNAITQQLPTEEI